MLEKSRTFANEFRKGICERYLINKFINLKQNKNDKVF